MEEHELLHRLLQNQLPVEETPRPVALRSVAEQRRLAFKPFLQRTWVDRGLYALERALVLILVVFFAFWFFDGYGRDWLYLRQQQNHPPQAALPALRNTGNQAHARTQLSQDAVQDARPLLPFTTPAMKQEPSSSPAQPLYLAPQPVAVVPEPADQRPFWLQMPALDVASPVEEVFVREGVWQVADYAVGYHHGSALPGEAGNVVMSGHAGLRGAVFRNLDTLQQGDDIFVDAGEWRYHYTVDQTRRVWPNQVEVMAPTRTATLTLITCTDWDTRRLVVVAHLAGAHPLPETRED